jgi:N-acetylglucosaminyldiphosphoundecaprenol N-acetyl-beta-D-mannosaminyltransferase
VNPEKVYVLRKNKILKTFFEQAGLLLPDGIGIVKALKFLHNVSVTRTPGADLMQHICAASADNGYRLFIYGAKEEVNAKAVDILMDRYPGIRLAGRANGYITDKEMPGLIKHINDSKADILFAALGSPRQEEWLHRYSAELTTVKVCQGIGGTLDTITGHVKRAPLVFQKIGLEWLYRLLRQPTRIGRETRLLRFVIEVLKAKWNGNKEEPQSTTDN